VTAVDYPGREKRSDVVYPLLVSDRLNERVACRAEASETTQVPSIIEVFPRRRLVRARVLRPQRRDLHRAIRTCRRLLPDYGFGITGASRLSQRIIRASTRGTFVESAETTNQR